MSAPPFMPLYVAEYRADTGHLGTVEHGAYLLLLMAMWRANGKLPADDERLSRLTLLSADEWAKVKPVVLEFFTRRGGVLTHKRVAVELKRYTDRVEQRKRAAQSGAKKAMKASAGENINENNENAPNLAIAKTEHLLRNQNQNQNQNQKDKDIGGEGLGARGREDVSPRNEALEPPTDWPAVGENLAVLAAREVNSAVLDPARTPGLVTTAARMAAWKRAGASWREDVIPALQVLTAAATEPIKSWAYFDGAIARSVSARSRPLEVGEAIAGRGVVVSLGDRIAEEHARANDLAKQKLERMGIAWDG